MDGPGIAVLTPQTIGENTAQRHSDASGDSGLQQVIEVFHVVLDLTILIL
jgi:hypothetical protein